MLKRNYNISQTRAIAALLSALATMSAVSAQTIYVNATCGNDAWTGTSSDCAAPNGPKRTIQAGIDASVNGDTVLVADGVYMGVGNKNLDYGGRAIRIQSEGGPEACIIDCDNDGRGFYFHNGETADSAVEGITVRNGFMNRGGAVLCEDGSSPLFQSCVFQHNSVSQEAEEDGAPPVLKSKITPAVSDEDAGPWI